MLISDWIAIGALLIASLGWWDNRRRINADSVSFQVEISADHGGRVFLNIWNSGRRKVFHPSIDPASVQRFAMPVGLSGLSLEPNEHGSFQMMRDQMGRLPESMIVYYYLRVGGRKRSLHVRFPTSLPEPSQEQ